jgi:hypothetical protein
MLGLFAKLVNHQLKKKQRKDFGAATITTTTTTTTPLDRICFDAGGTCAFDKEALPQPKHTKQHPSKYP